MASNFYCNPEPSCSLLCFLHILLHCDCHSWSFRFFVISEPSTSNHKQHKELDPSTMDYNEWQVQSFDWRGCRTHTKKSFQVFAMNKLLTYFVSYSSVESTEASTKVLENVSSRLHLGFSSLFFVFCVRKLLQSVQQSAAETIKPTKTLFLMIWKLSNWISMKATSCYIWTVTIKNSILFYLL